MLADSRVVCSAVPFILTNKLNRCNNSSALFLISLFGSTAKTLLPLSRNNFVEMPVPEPISAMVKEEFNPTFFSRKGIISFGYEGLYFTYCSILLLKRVVLL